MRHFGALVKRLGFFQIDSVNVLQRAQYMPAFSRLGPYDTRILHQACESEPRRLFEYWAHEAALVDVDLFSSFRFRMNNPESMWASVKRIADERPEFVAKIRDEVANHGPLTARELAQELKAEKLHWGWNWSQEKTALEYLFYTGQISVARRTSSFERVYDLTERVIPAEIMAAPTPEPDQAHRNLILHATRALGLASARSLRDYFRMQAKPVNQAIAELLEAGQLRTVHIEGSRIQHYAIPESLHPKKTHARALISPFDPLVFERQRLELLFDFHYRIEIYVPEAKRIHGYYVLPFLFQDRLQARVDLKANRQERLLDVRSAFAEPGMDPAAAQALARTLVETADWLGLDAVRVANRGDLATQLRAAVAAK